MKLHILCPGCYHSCGMRVSSLKRHVEQVIIKNKTTACVLKNPRVQRWRGRRSSWPITRPIRWPRQSWHQPMPRRATRISRPIICGMRRSSRPKTRHEEMSATLIEISSEFEDGARLVRIKYGDVIFFLIYLVSPDLHSTLLVPLILLHIRISSLAISHPIVVWK